MSDRSGVDIVGNPKRYACRGVTRMAPHGRPYRDQIEAPLEDIETEGDRQLQVLLRKQLNTQVTLQGQLSQKKSFTDGTVYQPLPVMGALSLDSYRHLDERARQIEELRQLGLSEEEIHLKLEEKGVKEEAGPSKRPRLGANPSILHEKLAAIEEKITKKKDILAKPDTFAGAKQMSRHEMDLEKAISHDREKAKLLGILMTSQEGTKSVVDPNDPINHLDDIWQEAMEARRKDTKKDRKKSYCKGCGKPIIEKSDEADGVAEECSGMYTEGCVLCLRRQVLNCDIEGPLSKEQMMVMKSLEDGHKLSNSDSISEKNDLIPANPEIQNTNRSETQIPHEQDNVQDSFQENNNSGQSVSKSVGNKPQKLTQEIEIIPEEVIRKYRLNMAQIHQLPRFQNYSPGEPSKTLYLKNLSARVEESDLVALFHRFQSPDGANIVYRLMTGRMRGQAFVTFENIETATKALELVNGYDFKGKHIIIQYGRKEKNSSAKVQEYSSCKETL